MTVNDPDFHTTEVHTVGSADPTVVRTTVVRENNAGWWLAALVAIVAILAVVFLVTRQPSRPDEQVQAAVDQARAQGALEAAQSSMAAQSAMAQQNANQGIVSAQIAAQDAASRTAQAASDATARAEAAARQANLAAERAALRAERAGDATVVVTPVPETTP